MKLKRYFQVFRLQPSSIPFYLYSGGELLGGIGPSRAVNPSGCFSPARRLKIAFRISVVAEPQLGPIRGILVEFHSVVSNRR